MLCGAPVQPTRASLTRSVLEDFRISRCPRVLLRDLVTRSFSESFPIPVAGGLEAILQDLGTRGFSKVSLLQVPSTPDCGMAGRRFSLLRLLRKKKKKEEESPEAAPAQQPEEGQQVQPLQEGECWSWATGLVAAAPLASSCPIPSAHAQGKGAGQRGRG